MGRFIPLSIPNFEGNEKKYVNDAIEQGWVSTGGAYITQLERGLAHYLGVNDVVACQSGTAGLHLAMVECGVKPGDMVIVPSLTFIAAVNPVRYQFADPVFMDCDDSLCMDPQKLLSFCEQECTLTDEGLIYKKSGQVVKAVVVVHVFGNLADMETIMTIAGRFQLRVIEDATEALGSKYLQGKYKGKYAGTVGDFGVYSFNGNKIITTGGGGAVTARESALAEHIRYLSTQAKDDALCYVHHEIGYNYRMTNLQAALGVAQLEELTEFIRRKQNNYEYYKKLLDGNLYAKLIDFRAGTESNKWFYALQFDADWLDKWKKDEQAVDAIKALVNRLMLYGIQTRPIWGLIHEQRPYKKYLAYHIERAKYYTETILNIPCSTQLTKEDIAYVVEMITQIIKESDI